jgi:hypothetical protein
MQATDSGAGASGRVEVATLPLMQRQVCLVDVKFGLRAGALRVDC